MQQLPNIVHVCGILAISLLGCDTAGPTCDSRPYSKACEAQLADRASKGDCEAAGQLGLWRMNTLEIDDKTTLALLRQWASCNPGGLPALAELLSRSCNRTDRAEAVVRMKEYMKSDSFKREEDSESQAGYPDKIKEVEASAKLTHPDCVNLN